MEAKSLVKKLKENIMGREQKRKRREKEHLQMV